MEKTTYNISFTITVDPSQRHTPLVDADEDLKETVFDIIDEALYNENIIGVKNFDMEKV